MPARPKKHRDMGCEYHLNYGIVQLAVSILKKNFQGRSADIGHLTQMSNILLLPTHFHHVVGGLCIITQEKYLDCSNSDNVQNHRALTSSAEV